MPASLWLLIPAVVVGVQPLTLTNAAEIEEAKDFCQRMVNGIYGKDQQVKGADSPLCSYSVDDSGTYNCDIAVQFDYRTTCESSCKEIGFECTKAVDDINGVACSAGKEVSCDTSLYSKICTCSGVTTQAPTTTSTTTPADPCDDEWAIEFTRGKNYTYSNGLVYIYPSSYVVDHYFDDDQPAGVYTLSARVLVTQDYNGRETLLTSYWYDQDNKYMFSTTGGFPTERDEFQTISIDVDTADTAPKRVRFYFGYPMMASSGKVLVRQLSLLDEDNNQYIEGGDMSCQEHPADYAETYSQGNYHWRALKEQICFVNQPDIDGMCGETVQLSGSDGIYVAGQGFNAQQCADACRSFAGFSCNGFAVDGDRDCHLFEEANECIVDNDEGAMEYYEMYQDCGEKVTCSFTIDNDVDAVYFNNKDITDSIINLDYNGSLYAWMVRKTVSFRWDGVNDGVLAIAGHEFDGSGSCAHSGLLLGCESDNADSPWNFVTSSTTGAYITGTSFGKDIDPPEDNSGHEWFAIDYDSSDWEGLCESTSSFYCCNCCDENGGQEKGSITAGDAALSPEKVWPCTCNTDAFFRITVPGIETVAANSDLDCEWEEEHPDKYLRGCTIDNCFDFDSLADAKLACEGYGPTKCGGVTYNGKYETRLQSKLIDASGQSSWIMSDCTEKNHSCADGAEDASGDASSSYWEDSAGYNCEEYASYNLCREDGSYGSGWDSELTFADFATCEDDSDPDTCFDATDVCCACGGGSSTLTLQPCPDITNQGECLSSYDSRSYYASPCCIIDARVGNGNTCEPQSFIQEEGLDKYATCASVRSNDCPETCLGEVNCDYWTSFDADAFSCASLELHAGCDCSGCDCPSTTEWRFIVTEVQGGVEKLQLTELSFLDGKDTLSFQDGPNVNPGLAAKDNGDIPSSDVLADGKAKPDQAVYCDELPCSFKYDLLSEPTAFQIGYGGNIDYFPEVLFVQYKDTAHEWITVWAGSPGSSCGEKADSSCERITTIEISMDELENCPDGCLGQGSCDEWLTISNELTCEFLEEEHECNCWRCQCNTGTTKEIEFPDETTRTTTTQEVGQPCADFWGAQCQSGEKCVDGHCQKN